jgi:hypothetical protein
VGRAEDKEGSPGGQEGKEKKTAEVRPVPKGNLRITHHNVIEEIKDINQELRKGRSRP